MKDQNSKKKPYNKWLSLMNIPFQMGIIILLGVLLGRWLDKVVFDSEKQLFIIVCSLLSVFVALYNVIKQVNALNK